MQSKLVLDKHFATLKEILCGCVYTGIYRGLKRVLGHPLSLLYLFLGQGLFLNLGFEFPQIGWKPASTTS